jgi:uncharacterized membrane protein YeaQ/YmgE (transglycosylase-associated protein family)
MNDVVLWVVIGLLTGGVAGLVLPGRSKDGALQAIIIGMLGAVIGGFVLDTFAVARSWTLLGALGVAGLGSVVLLLVMRSVDRTTRI